LALMVNIFVFLS